MQNSRAHLAPLTALRFFAALHVVMYHLGQAHLGWAPAWIRNIAATGYVSVGLFFVLSGFILTYTYADPETGFRGERRDYLRARVARIYPVYLLSLLCYAPFFISYLFKNSPPLTAFWQLIASGGLVLVLQQAWIPAWATSWNTPAWSLSVEAFFYLLLPWILPWALRLPRARLLLGTAAAWLAALIAPLLFLGLMPAAVRGGAEGFWINLAKFTPLFHLPEFLGGVLLGIHFLRQADCPASRVRAPLVALATLGALLWILGHSSAIPYLLLHDGLLAPLFGILIYSLAASKSGLARLLSQPVLVRLGEASYALYILHLMLWTWTAKFARLGFYPENGAAVFWIYLVAAILLAVLTHHYVEEPLRKQLRNRPWRLWTPSLAWSRAGAKG